MLFNTYRLGRCAGGTFTQVGTFARPRRSFGRNKYASGYVPSGTSARQNKSAMTPALPSI